MIEPFERLKLLYEEVKSEIQRSDDKKVTIFVSALEVDSVCALRILQGILKTDGVHHSIYPVTGYSQVVRIFREQLNDDDIKNVVLINFGACEDITQLLGSQENTRLIVIDSRRPINHNLIGEPTCKAVMIAEPDDIHPSGAQALPVPEGHSDDEGFDNDEEDDKENMPPPKRRRSENSDAQEPGAEEVSKRELRKRMKLAARKRRKEYYEIGAFWGCPAAITMMRLAQELNQQDKHTYWLGAVALTDQLVHQRIGNEAYARYAVDLETEIDSEGGPEAAPRIQITAEAPDGEIFHTSARNPLTRVTAGKDMRFALMRHWSLYESMRHSSHVAIRMQTWADKGRRKLDELLTKMGFKIRECKLDFSEMRLHIHEQLEGKLDEYGHTAQLNELAFNSFHLHWGYRTPLSATDAVYGVSALLESYATRPQEHMHGSDSFWRAWEALNPGNIQAMRDGLELAKQVQRAVLADGGLLVSRKDVRSKSAHFCHVDLNKSSITNKTLLSQPMALIKLGVFLRDQRAWRQPRKQGQAVILFGPATPEQTCLVVCVSRQPSISSVEGNHFPLIFEAAAKAAGCSIDYDGFDTCVGLVAVESIDRLVMEMIMAAAPYC